MIFNDSQKKDIKTLIQKEFDDKNISKFKNEKVIIIPGSTKDIETKLLKLKNTKFLAEVNYYKRPNAPDETSNNFYQVSKEDSKLYGENGYPYKQVDKELNEYLKRKVEEAEKKFDEKKIDRMVFKNKNGDGVSYLIKKTDDKIIVHPVGWPKQ